MKHLTRITLGLALTLTLGALSGCDGRSRATPAPLRVAAAPTEASPCGYIGMQCRWTHVTGPRSIAIACDDYRGVVALPIRAVGLSTHALREQLVSAFDEFAEPDPMRPDAPVVPVSVCMTGRKTGRDVPIADVRFNVIRLNYTMPHDDGLSVAEVIERRLMPEPAQPDEVDGEWQACESRWGC